jgi:hypothetical protein
MCHALKPESASSFLSFQRSASEEAAMVSCSQFLLRQAKSTALRDLEAAASFSFGQDLSQRTIRWRDQLGRRLSDVVEFFVEDETWRCNAKHSSPASVTSTPNPSTGVLQARLPSNVEEMARALSRSAVQLESVLVVAQHIFLTIRCLNVAFDKKVSVRASFDNWATTHEIDATFLSSCDCSSDRFSATIPYPSGMACKLQFAVSYQVDMKTYWDNNGGHNYVMDIQPKGSVMPGRASTSKAPRKSALRKHPKVYELRGCGVM